MRISSRPRALRSQNPRRTSPYHIAHLAARARPARSPHRAAPHPPPGSAPPSKFCPTASDKTNRRPSKTLTQESQRLMPSRTAANHAQNRVLSLQTRYSTVTIRSSVAPTDFPSPQPTRSRPPATSSAVPSRCNNLMLLWELRRPPRRSQRQPTVASEAATNVRTPTRVLWQHSAVETGKALGTRYGQRQLISLDRRQ